MEEGKVDSSDGDGDGDGDDDDGKYLRSSNPLLSVLVATHVLRKPYLIFSLAFFRTLGGV